MRGCAAWSIVELTASRGVKRSDEGRVAPLRRKDRLVRRRIKPHSLKTRFQRAETQILEPESRIGGSPPFP